LGQISQAFDHIKNKEIVNELSVVLYTDSFFYGFWSESEELLKTGSENISMFPNLIERWNNEYPLGMLRMLSCKIPYVHLPESDYKEKHFESYFTGLYNTKKRRSYGKEVDTFLRFPIHTLHYLESDVLNAMSKSEYGFKISHISTALANYAYLIEAEIIMFIEGKTLHMVCHKENQFHFYNQFHCVDANDFLYFILLVLQNLNIDYESQEIYLGGEISRISPLYNKLRNQLPKLILVDDRIKTLEAIDNPKQLYFDLYLCKTCV
jgi:hypothetical protein